MTEPASESLLLCHACELPLTGEERHLRYSDCARALTQVISELLERVGEPGTCKGCGMPIFWLTHSNGKKTPYTPRGFNHFIDCKKAKEFRR
jgi:hypothetical protein